MTSKSTRASLLYHVNLLASFQIHRWIQTGVTSRKLWIWVKIGVFVSLWVTKKFDCWHWKTIGHLFNTMSSSVHHFKAMGEFELELQSGNADFGSKLAIFPIVILRFNGWPWKTIGRLFFTRSSLMHHFKLMGEFKVELQSENAQFRSKSAFKFNGWPRKTTGHLFYAVSSSVHHFIAISDGFAVRTHPLWIKIDDFRPVWPWNLTDYLEKQ